MKLYDPRNKSREAASFQFLVSIPYEGQQHLTMTPGLEKLLHEAPFLYAKKGLDWDRTQHCKMGP